MKLRISILLCPLVMFGCDQRVEDELVGSAFRSGDDDDDGFSAQYIDCDEFAGVGIVPFENVVDRVPDDYVVIEAIPGFAVVVAQAGSCAEIVVDDESEPGVFAQFGVAVVPPGTPGTGDFYQLSFVTTSVALKNELRDAGVQARLSPNLGYEIDGQPFLSVNVPKPPKLAFSLDGPITLPDPAGPPEPTSTFNYWSRTRQGENILQQNVVEGIRFGTGTGVSLTAVGSEMQDIVGGTTLFFPFFSNPEIFEVTNLTVQTDVF